MSRTPRLIVSHILAAVLGAVVTAVALSWAFNSRRNGDTTQVRPESELLEARTEPTPLAELEPELEAIPLRAESVLPRSVPDSPTSEDLAAFEKTLFPKEHERMAQWGADLASYREYKLADQENDEYHDGSFAFFLAVHCQAANPEKVFSRMIQPKLREDIDASTRQSVDHELQQFHTEFNQQRKRLKLNYDADVTRQAFKSIADRTAFQKRETAMWKEMDEILNSITCERQLQALLGPPLRGSAYLSSMRAK